jgi:hypothetical protein
VIQYASCALEERLGEKIKKMAGNVAKITAINFDGVPTDLVNDCLQYVIRVINEAGYGDNVRIRGVAASALEQDGTVTSASSKTTAVASGPTQNSDSPKDMEVDDSDDDVVFVRASPPPAARVVVPVEIHDGGSGENESSTSGSSSGSSDSSDEGSDDEAASGAESPKYRYMELILLRREKNKKTNEQTVRGERVAL